MSKHETAIKELLNEEGMAFIQTIAAGTKRSAPRGLRCLGCNERLPDQHVIAGKMHFCDACHAVAVTVAKGA